MRLEYKFGEIIFCDLHPGDMIPDGCGGFKTLNEKDIDENGYLNYKQEVTNSLNNLKEDKSEYR